MKRLLMLLTSAAALKWAWSTFVPSAPHARPAPPAATPPAPSRPARAPSSMRASVRPPTTGPAGQVGPDQTLAAVIRKAVGPTIAERLLVDFPTREAIRDAPEERLLAVKGMGKGRLTKLRAHIDADIEDLLSGVKGLGPAKRQRVIDRFPTAMAFLVATDEQIVNIDGIGPALTAELIARRDTP